MAYDTSGGKKNISMPNGILISLVTMSVKRLGYYPLLGALNQIIK
jgi:hypothetical protein